MGWIGNFAICVAGSPKADGLVGEQRVADLVYCDLVIAGGGLAGGLIALALKAKHPNLDVRVIDSEARLGGNHIWSFFDSDIAPHDRQMIAPLIVHRWKDYDVCFPHHSRTLITRYNAIESEHFDAVIRQSIGSENIIRAKIVDVQTNMVLLDTNTAVFANGVIDARGPGNLDSLKLGWQKFLGQVLKFEHPHGLTRPIVMDAKVQQCDGYRFVYCLPFSPTEVFVEDTYYSDRPELDTETLAARIRDYVAAKGWGAGTLLRQETGVLPVAIAGNFDAYWRSTGMDIPKAGMRSGLFHPTTGYSLPDAVRLASRIANGDDFSSKGLLDLTYKHAADAWKSRKFYRMLDAMLFRAALPDQRYRVLERFYTLPPDLIGRFYAAQSSFFDKVRILTGRPPVPVWPAIRAILGMRL